MPTLYYRKDIKKWRVQIRNRGFKHLSITFDNLEDAKKFLEKSNKIMKKKKEISKISKALNMLKGEVNGSN